MENENISNNIDITPIVEELQILNKGVVSNGEKLDSITEYLITKDKEEKDKEEEQLKKEEEQLKKDQEEEELQKGIEQEKEQSQTRQTETYTEILTDIRDQSVVTNYILSGQIFFMGVLFGVVLLSVLWNRFIR